MPLRPLLLRSSLLAVGALLTGCLGQADLKLGVPSPAVGGPGGKIEGPQVTALKAQIRLLNASEYRNTVHDLLGLEASASLSFSDRAGGYDTGAGAQVDENLFAALLNEGERLATDYVAHRLTQDFGCFDKNDIKDSCIAEIVAKLAPRAFRKELSPEVREELLTFFLVPVTGFRDDQNCGPVPGLV